MNEPTGIQDRPYMWWIHVVLNLVVAHVNSDTGLETRVIVGNGRTARQFLGLESRRLQGPSGNMQIMRSLGVRMASSCSEKNENHPIMGGNVLRASSDQFLD